MDIQDELDPEEMQRRFDRLMESLSSGSLAEEDLTAADLELLKKLFGERADDLENLLEDLRRIQSEER
jgi:hypothetical protein